MPHSTRRLVPLAAALLVLAAAAPAPAQAPAGQPPAVGVVEAVRRPVTTSHEFIGRVEPVERVNLVARVPAFLEERLFEEGAELAAGELLFRLERAPYEAALAVAEAAVAEVQAELTNARDQLERVRRLERRGVAAEATLDESTAAERSAAARLLSAKARVRQAEINLGYTEIRAPIDGRIGRSLVDPGNVVGPETGTLARIVSQDPMYVAFAAPMRTALELRTRYADQGGLEAVAIRLRLPDGRLYAERGRLDFVDIEVGRETDTIDLRGTIANPVLALGDQRLRELRADEFVTVVLEAIEPVLALTVPREAVLSDQRGQFVYVLEAGDRVARRDVELGQSTPRTAVVTAGLEAGERVVVEGVQRVQPGMQVSPAAADFDPAIIEDATPALAP